MCSLVVLLSFKSSTTLVQKDLIVTFLNQLRRARLSTNLLNQDD